MSGALRFRRVWRSTRDPMGAGRRIMARLATSASQRPGEGACAIAGQDRGYVNKSCPLIALVFVAAGYLAGCGEALPDVARFPVVVPEATWVELSGSPELARLKGYFHQEGDYPVGRLRTDAAHDRKHGKLADGFIGVFILTGFQGDAVFSDQYESTHTITLEVIDWKRKSNSVFECRGQGGVTVRKTEAMLDTYGRRAMNLVTEEEVRKAEGRSCMKAAADLLRKLDGRRRELEALRLNYTQWMKEWE